MQETSKKKLSTRRWLFVVAGILVSTTSIFEGFELATLIFPIWGAILILTGLAPSKPPLRYHRTFAILSAVFTTFFMAWLAYQSGSLESKHSMFLILMPVLFLVLVSDDPIVSLASLTSSVIGLAFVGFMNSVSPWLHCTTTALIGTFAVFTSFLNRQERLKDIAIEKDRNRALQELALSERLRHQAENTAAVGRLASEVGHDINNPLTYLIINIEDVREQIEELKTHKDFLEIRQDLLEQLDHAAEGSHRIKTIVQDLRSMGKIRGTETHIQVKHVLESSIRMAWNEIRHRAKLVKNFTETPPILANESKLTQVFLNLLINASHAIREGHANSNEIRVSTGVVKENVFVEIQDTGQGIPQENLALIFDPFFTTKPDEIGNGLGLSICKRLIREINGTIEVESSLGMGSTFRVMIPISQQIIQKKESQKKELEKKLSAQVLIIDDEPVIRTALVRLLNKNHSSTLAASGAEAFEILQKNSSFDVILCDLIMPEMTGMELYREIGKSHPHLIQKFVFLTGGAFTEEARIFLEKKERPCLKKPIDREELDRTIQDIVSEIRPYREDRTPL